jgi:hypothetical protein
MSALHRHMAIAVHNCTAASELQRSTLSELYFRNRIFAEMREVPLGVTLSKIIWNQSTIPWTKFVMSLTCVALGDAVVLAGEAPLSLVRRGGD